MDTPQAKAGFVKCAAVILAAVLGCAAAMSGCRENSEPAKDAPDQPKEDKTQDTAAGPARPMRILFIGNSYTDVNDLPRMLEQFGRAAGRPIETARAVPGGWTLQKHWQDGPAPKMIAEGKWDYVVLQEQSQLPIVKPELMHKYVRLFDAEIRKVGAKTVLFMTWARRNLPQQQAGLTKAYCDVGGEIGAAVAPVGAAWETALAERPGLDLYHDDNSHPKPAGTYLAACVFYATLTGQSPEGMPAKVTAEFQAGRSRLKRVLADLSADEAAFLQRVAWKTVKAFEAATSRSRENGDWLKQGRPKGGRDVPVPVFAAR